MKRTVYRGISLNEAKSVIENQVYERNEKRMFQNGIQARSAFGQGIYLISDFELAAQYAFCHAEVEAVDGAAVLRQCLKMERPFILNYRMTEDKLRKKALSWKFGDEDTRCMEPESGGDSVKEVGQFVKEYLLAHGYDGIIYHVDDEIIYYVSYFQEKQIENISVDFAFDLDDLKNVPVSLIREKYKNENVNLWN